MSTNPTLTKCYTGGGIHDYTGMGIAIHHTCYSYIRPATAAEKAMLPPNTKGKVFFCETCGTLVLEEPLP